MSSMNTGQKATIIRVLKDGLAKEAMELLENILEPFV